MDGNAACQYQAVLPVQSERRLSKSLPVLARSHVAWRSLVEESRMTVTPPTLSASRGENGMRCPWPLRLLSRGRFRSQTRVRDEMGCASLYQSQCGAYTSPWWNEDTQSTTPVPVLTLGQSCGYRV